MEPENILLLIIIGLIILLLFLKINANNIRGKIGERRVSSKLSKIPNGIVINNLTFYANENKSCQIDHILVCSRGIFVVETKNYSGRIYGNDSQTEWKQTLNYGKVKNHFYSPVKQNNTHIYELEKRIPHKKYFNCVVFTKNNTAYIKSEYVFKLSKIQRYIMAQPEIYSMSDVELIANDIKHLHEEISNKEHVKNIKQMKKNIDKNICPRCGGQLILKTGQYGKFYGCSNYPKCKFIKKG